MFKKKKGKKIKEKLYQRPKRKKNNQWIRETNYIEDQMRFLAEKKKGVKDLKIQLSQFQRTEGRA